MKSVQTLVLGNRRFVVIPEREFLRLQRGAAPKVVRPEFGAEAMRELRSYRRTRKAADWVAVKKKMGL